MIASQALLCLFALFRIQNRAMASGAISDLLLIAQFVGILRSPIVQTICDQRLVHKEIQREWVVPGERSDAGSKFNRIRNLE